MPEQRQPEEEEAYDKKQKHLKSHGDSHGLQGVVGMVSFYKKAYAGSQGGVKQ